MTHFLFKPHVAGPSDDITTPDIVVDRVSILVDEVNSFLPVHRLSSSVELQVFAGKLEITPAYAFIACGGGALAGIATLIRQSGEPLPKSDVIVARSAWRLRNLVEHFDSLQLTVSHDTDTESSNLADLPQPVDVLNAAPDGELALPRGVIVLCPVTASTITAEAPVEVSVQLSDGSRARSIEHATELTSVDFDQWDARPLPRYTVGPVGEVQHYI